MIGLFGQATDRLCNKLDAAASDGEDLEMESLFSRLTLDIIGKAVFNYEFDSLKVDTGIVEVILYWLLLMNLSLYLFSFFLMFCVFFVLPRAGCIYCLA